MASIWRLHEEGLRQTESRDDRRWDDDLRAVPDAYLANGGEFLVGTVDGEVVAMGGLRRLSGTVGQITRIRVQAGFQGHGFGRTLLEALEDRARELGYQTVRLDATAKQTEARRLCESSGYSEAVRELDPAGQETIVFQKQGAQFGREWPAGELIETERLALEPLRVEHAEELWPLLDDPSLHEYIGGRPATPEQLRRRYARLVAGQSPDGWQCWLNWIVRLRDFGLPVGTVQATLDQTSDQLTAEIAWVIGSKYQRRGYAKEAAEDMLEWLWWQGVDVFVAQIDPRHSASMAVAKHLGLEPTGVTVEGEMRWTRVER
jgi:RimJ/RimL family protein N-acetyltransferase